MCRVVVEYSGCMVTRVEMTVKGIMEKRRAAKEPPADVARRTRNCRAL